ncbi:MAG: DUF1648 domain-containing protein [Eubacteriales bacterium]|nr:DUF1648 domain-containing protein [Eubacteriales bacterium]MDD4389465.1 DUF1648 domain-containing protein [Eubacteriales bacterium]
MKIKTGKINLSQKDLLFCKRVNRLNIVILVITALYFFFSWGDIPDRVPMHYNFAGEVDRYGNKKELIILPLLSVVMYGSMTLVEYLPPAYWNIPVKVTEQNKDLVYSETKKLLVTEKLAIVILFSYIAIAASTNYAIGSWALLITISLVFAPIIIYYIRIKKKHN